MFIALLTMDFEHLLVEKDGAVGIITLNRPQQLNALSYALVKELSLAMEAFDQDEEIRRQNNGVGVDLLVMN